MACRCLQKQSRKPFQHFSTVQSLESVPNRRYLNKCRQPASRHVCDEFKIACLNPYFRHRHVVGAMPQLIFRGSTCHPRPPQMQTAQVKKRPPSARDAELCYISNMEKRACGWLDPVFIYLKKLEHGDARRCSNRDRSGVPVDRTSQTGSVGDSNNMAPTACFA